MERLLRDVNDWRKERRRIRKEMQRMQRRWEMKRERSQTGSSVDSAAAVAAGKPASLKVGDDVAPDETASFGVAFQPTITVIPSTKANGGDDSNHKTASAAPAAANGNAATISTNDSHDNDDAVTDRRQQRRSRSFDAPALLTPTCDAGFPGEGSHDLLLLRNQLEKEGGAVADDAVERRPSATLLQAALIEEESHRVRLPSHTHAEVNDTRHDAGEIAPIAWIVIMAKVREYSMAGHILKC